MCHFKGWGERGQCLKKDVKDRMLFYRKIFKHFCAPLGIANKEGKLDYSE